ncbi:MAG: phosphoribosylformylglycinamidine cyclo-ligase [Actinomycetota bacterium]
MTDAYEAAGVSFTSGDAAVERIGAAVKSTHDERVVSGLGSFGGVFDLASLAGLDDPLLVASTDGVGTKTKLSAAMDRWEGAGADIVNHGINDVIVQGARPLFFLDTVAAHHLDPEIVGRIVDGMAAACREAGCVLLGGETAEMPGVFTDGAVDIAGTMVGAVARAKLLPRAGIAPGHVLVGIGSSGLHTNGYSLARQVAGDQPLTNPLPGGDGVSIGHALTAVHRSYLPVLDAALDADLIDALAHITGGGLLDNIPRVLPDGLGAVVDTSTWTRPALFEWLIASAELDDEQAHRIFNCGVGMIAIVEPDRVDAVQSAIDEPTWIMGEVVESAADPRVELA